MTVEKNAYLKWPIINLTHGLYIVHRKWLFGMTSRCGGIICKCISERINLKVSLCPWSNTRRFMLCGEEKNEIGISSVNVDTGDMSNLQLIQWTFQWIWMRLLARSTLVQIILVLFQTCEVNTQVTDPIFFSIYSLGLQSIYDCSVDFCQTNYLWVSESRKGSWKVMKGQYRCNEST